MTEAETITCREDGDGGQPCGRVARFIVRVGVADPECVCTAHALELDNVRQHGVSVVVTAVAA